MGGFRLYAFNLPYNDLLVSANPKYTVRRYFILVYIFSLLCDDDNDDVVLKCGGFQHSIGSLKTN